MNTELQKSMQVTGMVGSLDGYMLMVLGIMIFAGIPGGIANYFLSDRQGELSSRDGVKYAVLSVIAALTVPLFLNMLSSNLLEAARTRPVDFFVFAGFCLIYVVASRRLFENAANKLLSQIDQVKRDVNHLQQKREASAPAVMRVRMRRSSRRRLSRRSRPRNPFLTTMSRSCARSPKRTTFTATSSA